MKICLAQTRPFKGDLHKNIGMHTKMVQEAAALGAGMVFFSELSITGYEPSLAATLATPPGDQVFDVFQQLSDTYQVTIGAGMPTPAPSGIHISMLIFQPGKNRQVYSKQYLHEDEFPWFVEGKGQVYLEQENMRMAPAICYELSVPAHAETAAAGGAVIYLASVAKTAAGVQKAAARLSEIAQQYGMTVLMTNAVGPSDDFINAGQSAVWNSKGALVSQLDDTSEGMLIYDTKTGKAIQV